MNWKSGSPIPSKAKWSVPPVFLTVTVWAPISSKTPNHSLNNGLAASLFDLLTKKEASIRRKELFRLRRYLDGVKKMQQLPDIAIIVDQKREITAIRECRKVGIPIVSILDTNCDPDLIDIPIPGNDDSIKSIDLILKILTDSIIKGKSNS